MPSDSHPRQSTSRSEPIWCAACGCDERHHAEDSILGRFCTNVVRPDETCKCVEFVMDRRTVLLDLCCKAGGATKGYQRAGFYVIGVDKDPQPNYCGDRFVQADALAYLEAVVQMQDMPNEWTPDAIHASFPCQSKTAYRRKGHGVGDGYPNLVPEGRELLERTGLPYVIENVEGFRDEMRDPITLCGSMFGLDVRRHRLFETNFPVYAPPCNHAAQKPGRFPGATNRAPMSRATVEVGVWRIPLDVQQRAMGIDWMTLEELSEAIPPAYTEHIGAQLLAALELKEAA